MMYVLLILIYLYGVFVGWLVFASGLLPTLPPDSGDE